MQILFLGLLAVTGAVMGSFLCCQARRMRLREGRRGARETRVGVRGAKLPARGARVAKLPARSICLHCRKQLKWYDNLPIISWLCLRGRCRFCHKKIGAAEFIAELAMAGAFLLVGWRFLATQQALNLNNYAYFENVSGINWGILAITLALTTALGFLAIYDGLYGELPNLCLTISLIFAIILVALKAGISLPFADALLAAALFGGIYLVLYLVSRGRWVGDGDWILAGIIGLALGQPLLALVALFLANFLALVVMLPSMVQAGQTRKSHMIYFGPFLVAAFVIVNSFANEIAGWFLI